MIEQKKKTDGDATFAQKTLAQAGNTKGGSITVLLTTCLIGLD